jgi:ribonuclease HI
MPKQYYYAVRIGRIPGIYMSWNECEKQVKNFPGTKFKRFKTYEDAYYYINGTLPISNKIISKTIKKKQPVDKTIRNNLTQTDVLYIYTDGSCIGNGTKRSRGGYGVYIGGTDYNDPKNISAKLESSYDTPATNNRAELKAIIEAFYIIEKYFVDRNIIIYSDSKYSIKCCTGYGKKMSTRNWINDKGEFIPNHELVIEVFQLAQKYSHIVTIKHIRAHTEKADIHSLGNDFADKLAKQGVSKY